MSDQSSTEAIELPHGDDAAYSALMDFLAPEESTGEAASGDASAGEAARAAGVAGAAGAPAGAEGVPADAGDAPGAGATAEPGTGAAATDGAGTGAAATDGAGAGGDAGGSGPGDPADTGSDPVVVVTRLGEISTALEERTAKAYQSEALESVRTERAKYFEALETHPRLMVGQEVPALDGTDNMEILRSTEDAREWQEAVKSILVEEVRSKASKAMEDNAGFLTTMHASIELFQTNPDLIPNTKGFDQELANRFAALAEPYELRVDNKLQGYSIQVQPLVAHVRAQLAAERAAAKASPAPQAAAPAGAAASTPAAPAPPVSAPQAGIPSKAGSGAEQEDFSVLFGTIGLPNLRI